MPRIIEIVLFLTPFVGFALWRVLFPSPVPTIWLVGGLAGFLVLTVAALLWLRYTEAEDAKQPYIPAELHDGRVVTPKPAASS